MAVTCRCLSESRAATTPFPRPRRRTGSSPRARLLPLVLACALFLVILPGAQAGPGEHTTPKEAGYGDHPGNRMVREDGAACFQDTAARDGTTCAVLYGHVFDFISPIPLNVQRPPVGVPDLSVGMSGAPTVESQGFDTNQYIMKSSPGFVEYYDDRSAEPYIHPEKGLDYAVALDDEVPVRGYFWLSVDTDEFSPAGIDRVQGHDPHIGVAPCLAVRMAVATTHTFGEGETIAEGTTVKTLVSHGTGDKTRNGTDIRHACVPGGEAEIMEPGVATEFAVDLGVAARDLPKDGGFHVEVEWYQFAPGDPKEQNKVSTPWINVHTGHDHPNRVVVPYTNPIRMPELDVTAFDGQLWFRPTMESPWGSYDIDPTNISIEVTDRATGDVVASNLDGLGTFGPLRMTAYDLTHAGHYDPVVGLVPWDVAADDLAAGTYTATVTVWNWQHTATASAEVALEIDDEGRLIGASTPGDGSAGTGEGGTRTRIHGDPPPETPEDKGVPAPGLPLLLLAAGALVWVARQGRPGGPGRR